MRKVFFILLLYIAQTAFPIAVQGQITDIGLPQISDSGLPYFVMVNPDSCWSLVAQAKDDTTKINQLRLLGIAYTQHNQPDSAFRYFQQVLDLSQKAAYLRGAYAARFFLANYFADRANFGKALEFAYTNLHIAEQLKDTVQIIWMNRCLSSIYADMNDFNRQLEFARKVKTLVHSGFFKQEKELEFFTQFGYMNFMATAFEGLHQLDSARYYRQRSYNRVLALKYTPGLAVAGGGLADIFFQLGMYDSAFLHAWKTIEYAKAAGRNDLIAEMYLKLAKLYARQRLTDSALYYGKQSLRLLQQLKMPAYELPAASFLDSLYAKEGQMDSAYKYVTMTLALKDSLFNEAKVKQVQNLQFNEVQRQKDLEQQRKEAQQQYQTNLKLYSLAAGLLVIAVVAFFLYRNSQQKQKVNAVLQQKNEQIEHTLHELKTTQAQLIQSEKMASLGELTAGIAHEIQNPLNFVNNFSETNTELLQEARIEFKAGNNEEGFSLLNYIQENEGKINHHGKRADSIVKGMLEHSRTSKGEKQATEINALADEYLRLSYHGMRAKDKSFNAQIQTGFDKSIEKINIIPQDIGRVLLNVYNNAFYAVNEKKKAASENYEPTVSVSTRKVNNKIEIRVQDNGMGISKSLVDKIFQPFFTTKPAGQGTGLGLSLSYDTIKVHGGELLVETEEGKGTVFRIQLPLK